MSNVERLFGWTKTSHDVPVDLLNPTKNRHPAEYVVLVIGAQRNIGALTALQYAQSGVKTVLLTSRNASTLESTITTLKEQLGNTEVNFRALECDPSNNESVERLTKTIEDEYKRLDIVVYNAGFLGDIIHDITKNPPSSFKATSDVNYLGTFHAMHHLIPLLLSSPALPSGVRAGNSFVCTGSMACAVVEGILASPQYCVSKLGQARLCEFAALQFADKGLLVGCVNPGSVNTDSARSSKGMEAILDYANTDPKLQGAFTVWLTSQREDHMWLSGRLIGATWDVDELVSRKEEVISKDLFKARFNV